MYAWTSEFITPPPPNTHTLEKNLPGPFSCSLTHVRNYSPRHTLTLAIFCATHPKPKRTILNYHCLTLYFISKWSHYIAASEQLQIHRAHSRPQTNWNRRRGALVSPLSSLCLSSAFCSLQKRHALVPFSWVKGGKKEACVITFYLFFCSYRAKPRLRLSALTARIVRLASACSRITVQAKQKLSAESRSQKQATVELLFTCALWKLDSSLLFK